MHFHPRNRRSHLLIGTGNGWRLLRMSLRSRCHHRCRDYRHHMLPSYSTLRIDHPGRRNRPCMDCGRHIALLFPSRLLLCRCLLWCRGPHRHKTGCCWSVCNHLPHTSHQCIGFGRHMRWCFLSKLHPRRCRFQCKSLHRYMGGCCWCFDTWSFHIYLWCRGFGHHTGYRSHRWAWPCIPSLRHIPGRHRRGRHWVCWCTGVLQDRIDRGCRPPSRSIDCRNRKHALGCNRLEGHSAGPVGTVCHWECGCIDPVRRHRDPPYT